MHASLLGFDGKWAIHPDQIAIANEVFAPTADEIADAERVDRDLPRRRRPTGSGAIGRDGRLVDAAHMRLAANVLHKAALAAGERSRAEGRPHERPTTTATYRVVQWATGNIGSRAAARRDRASRTSTWSACYVHSPDKVGLDAGELCGLGPTGVLATGDIDDDPGARRRLRPLHAAGLRLRRGVPAARRRAPTSSPPAASSTIRPAWIPAVRDAGRGGLPARAAPRSTAPAAAPGSSPRRCPLVLTSIQRRLDRLQIDEFADLSQRDSPTLLFELMGFGADPAALRPRPLGPRRRRASGPRCGCWPRRSALPLDSVEASGEVATAAPHDRDRGRAPSRPAPWPPSA